MSQRPTEVIELLSDDEPPMPGQSKPSEPTKSATYLSISDDGLEIVDVQSKSTSSLPDRIRHGPKHQNIHGVTTARPKQGQVQGSVNKPRPRSSPDEDTSPRRRAQKRAPDLKPQRLSAERHTRGSNVDRLEDYIQEVHTERASESRDQRWCTACTEDNDICDGKQPCNRCAELRLDCLYTDIPPPATRYTTADSLSEGDKRHKHGKIDTTPDVEPDLKEVHGIATSVSAEDSSRADACKVLRRKLTPAELHELEDVPRNSWLPQSVHEMRETVKAHQDNLNAHREYLLQAQLAQARVRARQKPTVPDQTIKINPFKKLLQEKEIHNRENPPTRFMKLQFKVHGAHRGSRKNIFQTMILPVASLQIDPKAPVLPKYKSIGRLGTSFLSRNVHSLLSLPYFADEEGLSDSAGAEREAELNERYRNNDIGMHDNPFRELRQQRQCLERIWHWANEFTELIEEIQLTPRALQSWLQTRHARVADVQKCNTCNLTCDWLPKPVSNLEDAPNYEGTSEEVERCRWLYEAFTGITSIPLWHFFDRKGHLISDQRSIKAVRQPENDAKLSLCSICFVHNCQTHGSYIDGDEKVNEHGPFINDPEIENNTRVTAVVGKTKALSEHVCGLFCCGLEQFSTQDSQVIGLDHTGRLHGKHNVTVNMVQELANFRGTIPCGKECFLDPSNRQKTSARPEKQTIAASQLARSMVKLYSNNLRLPCMIAKIARVSCTDALRQVLYTHREPPHPRSMTTTENMDEPSGVGQRKISNRYAGYNVENSADIDKRGPILPCSHSGPCLKENGCHCAHESVHCEWFCGCNTKGEAKCKRRFRGCNCRGSCFRDSRCECWTHNRECDPWLCRACGVLEVLDPPNKYRPEIRAGRCQNNKIQLDLPAKTIKAPSEVQGWGLFAGEDLDKHAFIGEYKGEIISAAPMQEADRRGVVYHNHGLEYLFMTNEHQEMDGSTFGNKTRFMNNSQLDAHINVLAQKLIANGVARIMFYTARPVKAGEELLYNYHYPQAITKHFWEKGDRVQTGKNGLIMPVSKPRLPDARVTREALTKTDGEQQPARKRVAWEVGHRTAKVTTSRQRQKRKRVEDEAEADNDVGDEDDSDDESLSESAEQLLSDFQKPADRSPAAQTSASDDDYEEEAQDEDSLGESDMEPEPDLDTTGSEDEVRPRMRRTRGRGFDTRFGGQAQRKAAATRRERAARGEKY